MRLASGFAVIVLMSVLGCELVLPVHETAGSAGSADSGGSFCASQPTAPAPTLCDDFDLGPLNTHLWLSDTQSGEVTLDSKNYLSPGYSLASSTEPIDAGAAAWADLITRSPLAAAPKSVQVSFAVEMRSVSVETTMDQDLFVVQFGKNYGMSYAITLQYDPIVGVQLLESKGTDAGTQYLGSRPSSIFGFPLQTWIVFDLDVDFGANQWTLTIEGPSRIVTKKSLFAGAMTGPLYVSPGNARTNGPSSSWDFGIDNVLVNAN